MFLIDSHKCAKTCNIVLTEPHSVRKSDSWQMPRSFTTLFYYSFEVMANILCHLICGNFGLGKPFPPGLAVHF